MGCPPIVMGETIQERECDDLALGWLGRQYVGSSRNPLRDSLVWTGLVEIVHVFLDHMVEMLLPQHQDMIETFSARAPQKPFANCIGLGYAIGRYENLDRTALGDSCEGLPIPAVAVSNQEAWRFAVGRSLPQLLGYPPVRRRVGNAKMDHAPRGEFDDEKHVEWAKPNVDDRQEIAGSNLFRVSLQEGCPGLRSGLVGTNAGDVFLNGMLGDGHTQLE